MIDRCERYYKAQGLWRTDDMADPIFTDTVELDLSTVEQKPRRTGRPQDRVPLCRCRRASAKHWRSWSKSRALPSAETDQGKSPTQLQSGQARTLATAPVLIAAITSCTNTSNASVLIAAGLVAQKAVEAGLPLRPARQDQLGPRQPRRHRIPGAPAFAVSGTSGLPRRRLRLHHLHRKLGPHAWRGGRNAVTQNGLVAAAVLSGNRNFEGRIHSAIKANYLASPPWSWPTR